MKFKEFMNKVWHVICVAAVAFWHGFCKAMGWTYRVLKKIWHVICVVAVAIWKGTCATLRWIRKALKTIWMYIYLLRGLLLAMPVTIGAVIIASISHNILPEEVGVILLQDGQFQTMISRNTAVMFPLAVTGVCVLLTVCSKKPLYPWLISIFSLVLPVLIYVTNMYPV